MKRWYDLQLEIDPQSVSDSVDVKICIPPPIFIPAGSVGNASNLHIVGAFLLNAREFSFLFKKEIQHTTVAYTVCGQCDRHWIGYVVLIDMCGGYHSLGTSNF